MTSLLNCGLLDLNMIGKEINCPNISNEDSLKEDRHPGLVPAVGSYIGQ